MRYLNLLLILISPLSFAIGIGEAKNQSSLGEKLNLEVPLHSTDGLSKSEIIASLASESEFMQLGVNKELFHNDFHFTLNQYSENQYLLLVTSSRAVNEPFVQFVLKISTPNETLLKTITTLLDVNKEL